MPLCNTMYDVRVLGHGLLEHAEASREDALHTRASRNAGNNKVGPLHACSEKNEKESSTCVRVTCADVMRDIQASKAPIATPSHPDTPTHTMRKAKQ